MSDRALDPAALARRDTAARRAALDVLQSCIVQAPAGSGKTELLIQRVLALLATVDAPEEIVAITFTRKAAAEMRVRIMRGLADAEGDAAVQEHEQHTRKLAQAVLARDAKLHWNLRDQPSRLRIMTIDALNGWIVRQMPWISGMGAQPAIADDAGQLYREAVRRAVLGEHPPEALRKHIMRLLLHLDNRYGQIEELLVQMLGIREQWAGLLTDEGGLPVEARGIIESSLDDIVQRQLRTLRQGIDETERVEIDHLARHAAARLDASEKYDVGALSVFLDAPPSPGAAAWDLRAWQAVAQLLLTGSDTLRSTRGITRAIGFEAGDAEKVRMIALLERMADAPDFIAALRLVRALPATRFTDAQWDILDSILEVLRHCVLELRTIFAVRGTVDHVEIAASALRALGGDLAPTDLAMMLEYRIRHILVDEFQDTSAGQFRLLHLLTAGWMPDDGHTLFLVGDPMQSIYRFREAEVGLFLRIWEDRRIASVPLQTLRLYRNFRSQEAIVTWVNRAFAEIMPDRNDVQTGAVAYVPASPTKPADDPGVRFLPFFDNEWRAEARGVAALLLQLGYGTGDGDTSEAADERTAILVRSRAHLAYIIPQLRAENIAFQAVEIESLAQHPAVQDVLALTRALLHTGDRTAWLAVLRAPFCGLTLEDIHALVADEALGEVLACMEDEMLRDRCGKDGRSRLDRITPVLSESVRNAGRRPLRRLVESCWIALGGPACVDAQGYDAVQSCFAMLDETENAGGLNNLKDLYERVDRLFAPPDHSAAQRLQVMTIHKSKGLQFDHVILPRIDGPPRRKEERLLIWLENAGPEQDAFIIAPLRERGSEKDDTYRYVQNLLAEKEDHEYTRLLYVAATRARRRLYLTATLRVKEDGEGGRQLQNPRARSFLDALWPLYEKEAAAACAAFAPDSQDGESMFVRSGLRRLRDDWQAPPLPEPLTYAHEHAVEDAVRRDQANLPWRAGEEARLRGSVVHRLLAEIGRRGVTWWMESSAQRRALMAIRVLRHLGGVGDEDAIADVAVRAVDAALDDSMGRWLLASHDDAHSEWEITGNIHGRNETIVLDRTFLDGEGFRWIIDFKSSVHEGADVDDFLDAQLRLHAAQLLRYSAIMRAYDGRPQRLLLYFPLLRAWRELMVTDQETLPPSS